MAENQTNIQDPGYPMDVALADNGVVMMVAYQFVDSSETTSYIAFIISEKLDRMKMTVL